MPGILTDADVKDFTDGLAGLKKFLAARKRIEKKLGVETDNDLCEWEELIEKNPTNPAALFFSLGRISSYSRD
jgi:hypothetical protein